MHLDSGAARRVVVAYGGNERSESGSTTNIYLLEIATARYDRENAVFLFTPPVIDADARGQ